MTTQAPETYTGSANKTIWIGERPREQCWCGQYHDETEYAVNDWYQHHCRHNDVLWTPVAEDPTWHVCSLCGQVFRSEKPK